METKKNQDETEALVVHDADYEKAVHTTSFGKFNVVLMSVAFWSCIACMFQNTSISYVFPAAQCDLKLTENNKGFLNASTFIGMVFGSLVWGFLADMYGRRRILIICHFLDGTAVFISAFSQNFIMLAGLKLLGGLMNAASINTLSAYIAEFHTSHLRAKILTFRGLMMISATPIIAGISWIIFPLDINFTLFENMDFHGWNILLLILCIPSFMASIGFYFLPESPKFLMCASRNAEAIEVLQKMYSMNSSQPEETYPIKSLLEENSTVFKSDRTLKGFITWWHQFKPLFFPPYVFNLIKMCSLDFAIYISLLGVKLWLPQIYTIMVSYKINNNGSTSSFCEMLTASGPTKNINGSHTCHAVVSNNSAYLNTFIIFGVTTLFCIVVMSVIEILGKKRLLVVMLFAAAVTCYSTYFAQDVVAVTALLSVYMALVNPCIHISISAEVELFPTSMRATAVVVALMCGKMGAVVGNLLFPTLLKAGCLPVFLFFGTMVIGAASVSMFIPNTENQALK